jgi:serine/threonine protein kinase
MATATLLRAGDVVGGFRIDDVIGIGGMAIVYRAEQVSLGRPVALKVLSSKLTSDPIFRERFRREGTHAATLEHPNIVPVYDSGEQDGLLYLAMRLVEGTNLAELVQTRGVTADQTIETLRPIASALDTAHAAGLIHRDIKPQNILITPQGHPYLADFGVAKGSNTYGLTATGGFVGSVNYASPEQIKGLTLSPASDVYALTAVLYQCLTGHVPYPRETDAGIMHAHLHEPPPTLPPIAGANSDFHTVLARGMAKDAGARYGHAGDLINAAGLSVSRLPSHMRKRVPAFPDQIAEGSSSETPAGGSHASTGNGLPEAMNAASFTAADRKRPPAHEREEPKSGRRWPLVASISLAVLAIGAAIAVLASGSSQAQGSSFNSGHLLLSSVRGWHRSPSTITGLALIAPITIAAPGARVVAGQIADPDRIAGALPASVFSAFGKPTQETVIALPLGPAKRYSWTGSSRPPMSVVIVATEAGEIAIACSGSMATTAQSNLSGCSSVDVKARIIGTQVDYPGPDPRVATALAQILASRSRFVAATPAALHSGRLPSRATALEQAVAIDNTAAKSLQRMGVAARYRAPIARLANALAREAGTLRRLAAGARAGSRSLYASVRDRLATMGDHVSAAAQEVSRFGFTLGHIGALDVPSPPSPPASRVQPATAAPAPFVTQAAGSDTPNGVSAAPTSTPAPTYTPPSPAPPAKATPEPYSKESPQSAVSAPS